MSKNVLSFLFYSLTIFLIKGEKKREKTVQYWLLVLMSAKGHTPLHTWPFLLTCNLNNNSTYMPIYLSIHLLYIYLYIHLLYIYVSIYPSFIYLSNYLSIDIKIHLTADLWFEQWFKSKILYNSTNEWGRERKNVWEREEERERERETEKESKRERERKRYVHI